MNSLRLHARFVALAKTLFIGMGTVLFLIAVSARPAAAQGFQVPPTYAVGANPNLVAVGNRGVNGYAFAPRRINLSDRGARFGRLPKR